MHEFRRQLQYKAALHGAEAIEADRWSECGAIAEKTPLAVREWMCDRDINAAKNLRRVVLARASCARSNACGEEGSGAVQYGSVKPASMKQESSPMSCLGMV